MSGPFYNNIKGTTGSGPGTGAFTPNAAATGFLAWSTVPAGWVGLVRYDDGSAWELRYGYWDGSTISRPTAGFVSSSSGSGLSLSASAVASLVPDGLRFAPDTPGIIRSANPTIGSTAISVAGFQTPQLLGTSAGATIQSTNYLTTQPRVQITSATSTGNAANVYNGQTFAVFSTTAGRGGFRFASRYGASQLPTGPRMFVGVADNNWAGAGGADPSTFAFSFAVHGLDSADSGVIQLITNNGSATANKTSTGITLAVNGWYESVIWCNPGTTTVQALLIRWDTGEVHYASTSTKTPASGTSALAQCGMAVGASSGTAVVMHFGGYTARTGTG